MDDPGIGLDAMAQAELVRRREVSALELVEAAIARIERVNPRLNAVITRAYDQARAAVATLRRDARFAGVPFLLKDLVATQAGVPQSGGSAALAGWVPAEDSELVARYKRAGLVILGKTNVPEFGIPPTTEPRAFGPTHNPWDPRRTPGGSSGGSAAAVAAGLVAAAHANDGGGSIRIPASCCGVFGLKPTRGRNPLGPAYGDMMSGLVSEHVVSRTVRDSAALLDVTAGPDVGDPYWAPPTARPYLDEVGAAAGRLRIAFSVVSPSGGPVHPDCAAAARDAAALCAALGHDVDEAAPELDQIAMTRAFLTLYAASAAHSVAQAERATGRAPGRDHLEPLTRALAEMGNAASAASYVLALEDLQRTARAVARFFLDYDVWLTPVLAEPPVPLGTLDATEEEPLKGFFRAGELCPFTPICNVTGQPAMSVPLFWNDAGLPIGSHFAARFGDEATLFRLAAQLEAARPWAGRRPPISA